MSDKASPSPAPSPQEDSSGTPDPPSDASHTPSDTHLLADDAAIFACTPGTAYSLDEIGRIFTITSTNGVPDRTVTERTDLRLPGSNSRGVNSLAIGAGGTIGYALRQSGNKVDILKVDHGGVSVTHPSGTLSPQVKVVAGGMDPSSSLSPYYFGGFTTNRHWGSSGYVYSVVFHLWKFDPTADSPRIEHVGHLNVASGQKSNGVSGDLAFTSSGDLIVLWSGGAGTARLVTVTARDLATATGGLISDQASQIQTDSPHDKFNGIAFDERGRILAQSASTASTTLQYLDPDSLQVIAGSEQTVTGMGVDNQGTDLASCVEPPTIALGKTVTARAHPDDQFTLKITRDGLSQASAQTTTSGTSTGRQEAQAGGILAISGETYRLSELGSTDATSSLADYRTSASCQDGADGNRDVPTRQVSEHAFTVTIPSGHSAALDCVLVNTPGAGPLTWTKTSDSGDLLAGSSWRLTPASTDAPDAAIEITDRTDSTGPASRDSDPIPGAFSVEGVPPGDYTLTETVAPSGYVARTDPIPVTITAGAASTDLGAIRNRRITGSATWAKTDSSQTPVNGSSWTITPRDSGGRPLTIDDCVAASPSDCRGPDVDPAAGEFTVVELPAGVYDLSESRAPVGFVLDDSQHEFEISEDGATVTVPGSPFVNEHASSPALPFTGGTGRDRFLLASAALLIFAAGGAYLVHRRSSQKRPTP